MPADRLFHPTVAAITLGLLDGETHSGHIGRFSPAVPDLALTLARGPSPKTTFAAERIAYVGFHKAPGDPPPLPNARKGALKVHVCGGKTFLVDPHNEPPG